MTCPYRQTLEHFGLRAQLLKLREECLELAEAITDIENAEYRGIFFIDPEKNAHMLDEAGDVLNVLRSLMTACPQIEQMAATKMLRTQIRMKTGHYDGGGI